MSKGLDALKMLNNGYMDNEKVVITRKAFDNQFAIIEKELKEYDKLIGDIFPHPKENGEEYRQLAVKRLLAFEIIIDKEVNVEIFKMCLSCDWSYELFESECTDNNGYNEVTPYKHSMTNEQFNLLKDVLLDI